MSDQVVLHVDRLNANATLPPCGPTSQDENAEEEMPLIEMAECRICQEEDLFKNLETPCGCSGSLKYAHRKCVQRWCDEKRDTTCEICHQIYQPGYTVAAVVPFCSRRPDDITIDINRGWLISGMPVDLHNPHRLLDSQYDAFVAAEQRIMENEFEDVAAAERRYLEAEYNDYTGTNAAGAAFCRFAALTLMALFFLRHAMETTDGNDGDDDDIASSFSIFLMRALGFLLPFYIMAWAINVLQRRREREEEARIYAASEVALVLQSVQDRGLQVTIVPGPGPGPSPASATLPEPHQ